MPVTIGQLTTDIIADRSAPPATPARAAASPPDQQAAIRVQLSTLARNQSRTQAEGFDD